MENVDRNKLLLEYQKLLGRLDKAETWAREHCFICDDVKKYNINDTLKIVKFSR